MRKILPILTALAVVFSLCVVPVFAEDVYFLPASSLSTPEAYGRSSSGLYVGYTFAVDSQFTDVYYCNYIVNNVTYPCLVSLSSFNFGETNYTIMDSDTWLCSGNTQGSTPGTYPYSASYNSSTGLYYYSGSSLSEHNPKLSNVSSFSSYADIYAALSNYTPPAPEPEVIPQTITIPAGYVLYFKASSDVTAGITTNFAASNVSSFGSFDNAKFTQTYGTASTLPTPGTSGDWHNGNRFTWILDGGFLGFGSSFMTAKDFDSSSDYHYIYNPLISLFTSNSIPIYNQALRVDFTTAGVSDLYLIPLSAGGVTGDFSGFSSNTSETLSTLQVNVGTDGIISTADATTGELMAPVAGGDNSQYYYDSSDPSAQYKDLFSQFVNELKTIFGSVIGAFQTLINGASSFISSIGEIFSWLPSDIVNFLTSSLIVIVVAGVIKVVLP